MLVINASGWGRRAVAALVAVLVAVGVLTVGGGSVARAHNIERAPTDGFDTRPWAYTTLSMSQRTTVDGKPVVDHTGMVMIGPMSGSASGTLLASSDSCTMSDETCVRLLRTRFQVDSLTFRLARDGSVHDASLSGHLVLMEFLDLWGSWVQVDETVLNPTWSVSGRYANGELVLDLGTDIGVDARLVFETLQPPPLW